MDCADDAACFWHLFTLFLSDFAVAAFCPTVKTVIEHANVNITGILHVSQVGTDSAQIEHSTGSVKGNLYVVEGSLYDPFSPKNDVTGRCKATKLNNCAEWRTMQATKL